MKQHPLQTMLSQPNLKLLLKDSTYLERMKDPKTSIQARKEYLYLRGYYDFRFFVETFFPAHCTHPFSKMHEDFFADEIDPARRGRREVIAAPRGHAKTTFKVIFKVLHAIMYGYEQYILIVGHSAPEAIGKVRNILKQLEKNPLLHEVYGQLAPVKGQPGCSQHNFVTQNGIRVEAKTRGTQVRGMLHEVSRPTLVILDDIESPEKVINEDQRYKTQQWFQKDILKLGNVDGNMNVFVIGTCLHPEALLPRLLVTPGWKGRKYQAIISFATNQALWEDWKKIFTNLTNPNRESDAQAFYEANEADMLAGTEVLWPEGEPYLSLMKMIVMEGQASFQSEKQNEPYDPERQIFDMEQAKRFKVEYNEQGKILGIRFLDASERFVPRKHFDRIIAFHDPAMCENKDSDYAAIVVCMCDLNGYIYCLDAVIEKLKPSQQIEHALALHKKWNFDKLYLEENNFQGILKHHYRAAQDDHTYLRVSGVTQHHNKERRIASLEPLVTNGQLLFNADLTPRMKSQMQLFPDGNDDGPDALHGAVDQLRRRVGLY